MGNFLRFFMGGFTSLIFLATSAFAAPPAKEFGGLPLIYDAAISPDGTKIAAYVNMNGSYGIGIFYIDGSGQDPFPIGMEDGVKPGWIKWANNEIVLASIWQNQNLHGTPISVGSIFSFDVNAKKGKILIKPDDTKKSTSKVGSNLFYRQFNNVVIDYLGNDPEHMLMSFADDSDPGPEVQKVNVRTGSYQRIQRGSETIQKWFTDLRGEVRVGQGLKDISKEKWTLEIRESGSDSWSSYKSYPGLKADTDIYGFTSNPDEMVVGDYAGKDTSGLYVYDLGQKQITRKLFHNDNYDVGGLVYNANRTEIVGASYISEGNEIELFGSADTALEKLRKRFPDFTVDYMDSTADYSKVLVKVSNPSDAGGVFILDTKTNDVKKISALYGNIPNTDLGLVMSVRYIARDGQKIPAYVTIPPSITETSQISNLPFIILPHGGPYARDSKRFDYLAQFFTTRGYGVLQMNFRGSAGYGKDFADAGRERWVVMQEDVEDGTKWLYEKGYADPEKTCVAGWSYGGYAALIGSIKAPELYACTISMAGVTDLNDLINDMKKYKFGRLNARSFLEGFEDKDDVKENSPVKRAEEMTGPVFLAHGTLDQRVHFDQFKRMKSALKKSSAKVTAIEFKDEDHFLSNEKNRIEFFEELEKFLEKSVGKSEYMAD